MGVFAPPGVPEQREWRANRRVKYLMERWFMIDIPIPLPIQVTIEISEASAISCLPMDEVRIG